MNPTKQLYEAAKALIGDLINKRSHFNSFQNLCRVLSEYEQSIAIAGEKTKEQILSEATGWVMTRLISHPGMCIMYGNEALQAMQFYASQQTSAKDKEIAELKERISELEKLI